MKEKVELTREEKIKQFSDFKKSLTSMSKEELEKLLAEITEDSKKLDKEVDNILKRYNVTLSNNQGYDYVYIANMCKADFLGDSVPNEQYLAKYIKNVIDDPDGYDGLPFYRWYADTCKKGIVIDWEDMI